MFSLIPQLGPSLQSELNELTVKSTLTLKVEGHVEESPSDLCPLPPAERQTEQLHLGNFPPLHSPTPSNMLTERSSSSYVMYQRQEKREEVRVREGLLYVLTVQCTFLSDSTRAACGKSGILGYL